MASWWGVANNNTSSKRGLLLVAGVVLAAHLTLLTATAAPPASARRRPVRLRVYMHDVVGGPGQTAVRLVKGPGPENPSMHPGNYFGDTVAVDDLLTAGLAADSPPVGRAQGTYMTGSMTRPVFVVAVTLLLTAAGPYNGSTLVVAGRDDTSEPVRELAVVGGTGKLRRASGHVLWSTAKVESPVHAVLELDVRASVPGDDAGDDQTGCDDTDACSLLHQFLALPRPSLKLFQYCIELEANLASLGDHGALANARKLYDSAIDHYPQERKVWRNYYNLELKVGTSETANAVYWRARKVLGDSSALTNSQ